MKNKFLPRVFTTKLEVKICMIVNLEPIFMLYFRSRTCSVWGAPKIWRNEAQENGDLQAQA